MRFMRGRDRFPLLLVFCIVGTVGCSSVQTTLPTKGPIPQGDDGKILLRSRDAIIHGKTARYAPAPGIDAVIDWTNKDDYIVWEFEISHPGKFELLAMQGCDKASGGSQVEFTIGGKSYTETVQDSGSFHHFIGCVIGVYELAAEKHALTVKPLTKPGIAVMSLGQVALVPVREE
jgi:hypothetical protein